MRYPPLKALWKIIEDFSLASSFLISLQILLCFFLGFACFYLYFLFGRVISFFFSSLLPSDISFLSLLERAYCYSFLLCFFLSPAKRMLKDLLIEAPLLLSRRVSSLLELDSLLFDGDVPVRYLEEGSHFQFKYLPARKEIE